jgi:hypothetical protein
LQEETEQLRAQITGATDPSRLLSFNQKVFKDQPTLIPLYLNLLTSLLD